MVPGKGDIDVAGVVDYRRTDFSCRDARRFSVLSHFFRRILIYQSSQSNANSISRLTWLYSTLISFSTQRSQVQFNISISSDIKFCISVCWIQLQCHSIQLNVIRSTFWLISTLNWTSNPTKFNSDIIQFSWMLSVQHFD